MEEEEEEEEEKKEKEEEEEKDIKGHRPYLIVSSLAVYKRVYMLMNTSPISGYLNTSLEEVHRRTPPE